MMTRQPIRSTPIVETNRRFIGSAETRIDLEDRQLYVGAERRHLTPAQWEILRRLWEGKGKLVDREQLARAVYPAGASWPLWAEKSIDVRLSQLRYQLAGGHWWIETVWRQGWRLRVELEERNAKDPVPRRRPAAARLLARTAGGV